MRTGYKVLRKNGKENGSYHNGLYRSNMGVYRGHIGGLHFYALFLHRRRVKDLSALASIEACDLTAMRHKDSRTRQGLGSREGLRVWGITGQNTCIL